MADFLTAYKKTSVNEGGYSNDPADKGGETWKGIARKKHPFWVGWQIIDSQKSKPDFPKCLYKIPELEDKVQTMYKYTFWTEIKGAHINEQAIADSLYDSTVNMGPGAAIKLAQRALGIKETGVMDEETLKTING